MTHTDLVETVRRLGPWFHQIDVGQGVRTRDIHKLEGPQALDHPAPRWRKIGPHLPEDMTGMRILDIGCSDGFFAIEFARRGAAEVVAIDASVRAIERLTWLTGHFRFQAVKPEVGSVYDLDASRGRFDLIFNFALLYHLTDPLRGLEALAPLGDLMLIETIAEDVGEQSHLRFEPPRPGVSARPKWFPTTRCVRDMLTWVGYDHIEELAPPTDRRPIYLARRT
jgi:tRNA (mo5U34)-methyltransferase